jgi:soluble lytic murein transglycosylase-like protein
MPHTEEADNAVKAMYLTRLIPAALVLLALTGSANLASAQIFSCRDDAGNIILSDQRGKCGGTPSYAVGGAARIRTTRMAINADGVYDALIDQHARDYGVNADLVRAVIQVESGFNPRARSPKGAMGLMQLMPSTAAEFGVGNAYSPADNIRGGVAYLRSLLDRYGHDETLALAAYNAGPTAVEKYGNAVPPYRETKNYVNRIHNITGPVARAGRRVFYKTVEMVDGRPVPKYTNARPSSGQYEVVAF